MKKIITSILAIAALGVAMAEDVQGQISRLQQQLNELKKSQTEEVSRLVRNEIKAIEEEYGYAEGGDVVSLARADKLTISGDLRLRWEWNEWEIDSIGGTDVDLESTRDRFRTRARLNLVWKETADAGWEVGFSLATGRPGGDPLSRNETWGSPNNGGGAWATEELGWDKLYAKHMFTFGEGDDGITLMMGKTEFPFQTSFLMWDSDIRPEGFTVAGQICVIDALTAFATAGAYIIDDNGWDVQDDVLYGLEVGAKGDIEAFDYMAAVQWYELNTEDEDFTGLSYLSLIGEVGYQMDELHMGVMAHVWQFLDADRYDVESDDLGWVIGVNADWRKLSAAYHYGRVEFASYPFFPDSDFMGYWMDAKGHEIEVAYEVMKNMTVGLDAIFVSEVNDDILEYDGTTVQLDLTYKF